MARQTTAMNFPFPIRGVDQRFAFHQQPEQTTVDMRNMRCFDIGYSDRARGAQRPGSSKYLSAAHTADTRIQDLNSLVSFQTGAPSSTSLSVRTITRVAVAGGTVKTFDTSSWTTPTGGSSALSANAPVIFSSEMFGDLFFADGINTQYYRGSDGTVRDWSSDLSAGTFPVSSGGRYPRLIVSWAGRIVMAGLEDDPHNWFMFKQGDPFDIDYSPSNPSVQDAVAGNNAPLAGKSPDVITSLVPVSNDVLGFGCDHSIYVLSGNPLDGGVIDLVTDDTGMAWGRPWTKDERGMIYFVGMRGGFYRWSGRGVPERISDKRGDHLFMNLDMDKTVVRCVYDDEQRGIWITMTDISGSGATDINVFYDLRTEAFCPDQFDNGDHQPVAVHAFDADDPDDRAVLFGGEDGFVRKVDKDAIDDDGTAIDSWVFLGPIEAEGGTRPFVLQQIQSTIGVASHNIDADLWMAESHEQIFKPGRLLLEDGGLLLDERGVPLLLEQGNSRWSTTLKAGRDKSKYPRQRGYVGYLRLRNNNADERWSMERVLCILKVPQGSRRRIYS